MTSDTPEKLKIPWIPSDYMFGCIDNADDAKAAADALRAAGFHAQDIQLLSGDAVINLIEAQCEQCDLVTRTLRFLWKYMTNEGLTFLDYAEEAKEGHTLIAIHVAKQEGIDRASRILSEHNAHRIEYWGHHGTQTLLSA